MASAAEQDCGEHSRRTVANDHNIVDHVSSDLLRINFPGYALKAHGCQPFIGG
jgi:hypothetical protein